MSRVLDRMHRGIRVSLYYAGIYFALAVVQVAATKGRVLGEWGFSLLGLVAFHLFAGVSTGLIIGLLAPLARFRVGAAAVGFVALLPLSFMMFSIMVPPEDKAGAMPWLPLSFAAVYGILGGLYFRSKEGTWF